jgi:hypothetical protein
MGSPMGLWSSFPRTWNLHWMTPPVVWYFGRLWNYQDSKDSGCKDSATRPLCSFAYIPIWFSIVHYLISLYNIYMKTCIKMRLFSCYFLYYRYI